MAEKRLPRSLSGCLEPPSAEPALDPSLLVPAQMSYRSTGLGFYAIAVRCCTMPLEKLAMIMNSAQVSGQGQMRQAPHVPLHRVAAYATYGCSLCHIRLQPIAHTVAAAATYGCSPFHIRLQVLRVAIDGPYLRAREGVALIFGSMLRKLP